jgi:hypothetical protein
MPGVGMDITADSHKLQEAAMVHNAQKQTEEADIAVNVAMAALTEGMQKQAVARENVSMIRSQEMAVGVASGGCCGGGVSCGNSVNGSSRAVAMQLQPLQRQHFDGSIRGEGNTSPS